MRSSRWWAVAGLWLSISGACLAGDMWISREEIRALPMTGEAWNYMKRVADTFPGLPEVRNQDDTNDTAVLAKALVYARTGDAWYRKEVSLHCMAAIGTERGGETLALARNLVSYVIAADLVGLDPPQDAKFREWLQRALVEKNSDERTLRSCHEDRPNNWGTMAGASRIAAAIYLGDKAELKRAATVFKGWLGDRDSYASFKYGGPDKDLSWQADPHHPVGINPKRSVKEGHSVDGALPEEMRRGDSFQWPPEETGYCWEALQGAFVQAELLHRQGFPVYEWQDQALQRSVEFLYQIGWKAEGDDEWIVWIINKRFGTHYPTNPCAKPGKNMGWTSWTHALAPQAAQRPQDRK